VRLLELTAAYGTLANGGYQVEPVYIREVRDASGQVLFAAKTPTQDQTILDPRVAFLITDILSDDEARLPSFGSGNTLQIVARLPPRPVQRRISATTGRLGIRPMWSWVCGLERG